MEKLLVENNYLDCKIICFEILLAWKKTYYIEIFLTLKNYWYLKQLALKN
jgi:hypothetical protein